MPFAVLAMGLPGFMAQKKDEHHFLKQRLASYSILLHPKEEVAQGFCLAQLANL